MGTTYEPRTTARLLITLAATLSLLAAQLAGLGIQPAHADHFNYNGFLQFDFGGGDVETYWIGDPFTIGEQHPSPDGPTLAGSTNEVAHGHNVTVYGIEIHISCSATLVGDELTFSSGARAGQTATIVGFHVARWQGSNFQTQCNPGTFEELPDLDIDKTASTATTSPGDDFTYTIEVESTGETAASNVEIVDTVPSPFVVTDATYRIDAGPENPCAISGNPGETDRTVTCGGAIVLPVGAKMIATIAVDVLDQVPDEQCTTIRNVATATAADVDEISDFADVTVDCPDPEPEPNVEITKLVDGEASITVGPGDSFSYTIEVTETTGDADAHDVVVTDELDLLDGDLTVTGTNPGAPDCTIDADDELTCDLGTLAAGTSQTITIDVDVADADSCGEVTNVASVVWDGGSATSDQTTVTIEGCDPDVSFEKVLADAAPDTIPIDGGTTTYELTATNDADATATETGVVIHDTVPAVFDIGTVTPAADCDVDHDANTVTCGPVDLAPGESLTVTIEVTFAPGEDVTADLCGAVTNSGELYLGIDNGIDGETPAATDSVDVTIVGCEPAIDIVKTASPTLIEYDLTLGDDVDVTYTYDVTNTGNVRLFDLTLVDDYELEREGLPVSVDLDAEIDAALNDQFGRDYLDPGETVTVTATFTLTLDDVLALLDESVVEFQATLDNIATTTGSSTEGEESDVQADDDAQVDILTIEVLDRVLGIELVKEALVTPDADGNKTITTTAGEPVTVTYQYTITNTGTETLFDLILFDDVIGDLTDDLAAVLEGLTLDAGESVVVEVDYTLTEDEVAAGEVANVAIVVGVDEFDVEVSDLDDEIVFVVEVLDVVEVVDDTQPLPRTGADTQYLLGLGLLLASLGLAALLFTPRRQRGIFWPIQ